MFANRTNWNLTENRLSKTLAEHRKLAKPLFDLTASNPTECGFKHDGQAILRALSNPNALFYHPEPKGLVSSRRAIADYYNTHHARVRIDDMVLTTSTSEAYSFVFRTLCDPHDEILAPAPSYPLFDFLTDIQDINLLPYPLLYDHGWQIDFHLLEKSITRRTRGVIVVHPNNPTGHFTKTGELARLNEICTKHELAVIADEVFLDFARRESPFSFAANQGALTFTLSGLSKIAGLPQMKVAWVTASSPEKLKSEAMARLEVIADTYLSMNTPVQLAIPTFLTQRLEFQSQLEERVEKNLAALDQALDSRKSCTRLKIEGGWYAVLRIPATRSD
jgi:alanine-synthesizing transaminase